MEIRLVPALALAAAALLVLKVAGLVSHGGYVLVGPASAGGLPKAEPAPETQKRIEPPLAPRVTSERPKEAPPLAAETSAEPALLERLGERRRQLDDREREIELRMRLLEAAEARIDKRVDELKAIEARIGAAVKAKEDEKTQQVKDLVSMYEGMKPKDAARVFDRLDPDLLVQIARLMNPRRLGEIVSKMEPGNAEKLTIELASREQKPGLPPVRELPKIEGR